MDVRPEIAAFYAEGREATRLAEGLGRLELARMQEILTAHLPPAPAAIADIGGGPGAHAAWLARAGYLVDLVDPIPLHVRQAEEASAGQPEHPIRSCRLGDAREVPLADATADAVLLHGPLYHLTERDDRLRALREAARVLRPGGVLIAVAIHAFASAIVGLVEGWVWDRHYMVMVRDEIRTGQHRPPPNRRALTTAYFHDAAGLAAEVTAAGFVHATTLGIEGPGWLVPGFDLALDDPAKRDVVLEIARLCEREPAHSPHFLAIARRPR
jgi:SAM-dependent methyltransferase